MTLTNRNFSRFLSKCFIAFFELIPVNAALRKTIESRSKGLYGLYLEPR